MTFAKEQSNLKRHTETKHIQDKPEFKCNQCDKIFARNDNLHQHKRTEHNDHRKTVVIQGVNDNNEPFSCYICNKDYKDKNSVLRPIEQKHAKKSFCCNIFSKFSQGKVRSKFTVSVTTILYSNQKSFVKFVDKNFQGSLN